MLTYSNTTWLYSSWRKTKCVPPFPLINALSMMWFLKGCNYSLKEFITINVHMITAAARGEVSRRTTKNALPQKYFNLLWIECTHSSNSDPPCHRGWKWWTEEAHSHCGAQPSEEVPLAGVLGQWNTAQLGRSVRAWPMARASLLTWRLSICWLLSQRSITTSPGITADLTPDKSGVPHQRYVQWQCVL